MNKKTTSLKELLIQKESEGSIRTRELREMFTDPDGFLEDCKAIHEEYVRKSWKSFFDLIDKVYKSKNHQTMPQERIKIGNFFFFIPVRHLKILRDKTKRNKGFANKSGNRTTNK